MPLTYSEKARVALERAKRSERMMAYLSEQSYVRILEDEQFCGAPMRGLPLYWRAGGAGHTQEKEGAGLYSGDAAWAAAHHCGPEKCIVFVVLRQKDERTQEEMPHPSVRFLDCREGTQSHGKVRVRWDVQQALPPPDVGRCLDFVLCATYDRYNGKAVYEVELGEQPPALDTLCKWHRAVAWALANLPEPRLTIPLW